MATEFEKLIEQLIEHKPELTRENIEEQIRLRLKKEKIGAGYLIDLEALFSIASDYGVSLSESQWQTWKELPVIYWDELGPGMESMIGIGLLSEILVTDEECALLTKLFVDNRFFFKDGKANGVNKIVVTKEENEIYHKLDDKMMKRFNEKKEEEREEENFEDRYERETIEDGGREEAEEERAKEDEENVIGVPLDPDVDTCVPAIFEEESEP